MGRFVLHFEYVMISNDFYDGMAVNNWHIYRVCVCVCVSVCV